MGASRWGSCCSTGNDTNSCASRAGGFSLPHYPKNRKDKHRSACQKSVSFRAPAKKQRAHRLLSLGGRSATEVIGPLSSLAPHVSSVFGARPHPEAHAVMCGSLLSAEQENLEWAEPESSAPPLNDFKEALILSVGIL